MNWMRRHNKIVGTIGLFLVSFLPFLFFYNEVVVSIFTTRDFSRGLLFGREFPVFGPETSGGGYLPGSFYYLLISLLNMIGFGQGDFVIFMKLIECFMFFVLALFISRKSYINALTFLVVIFLSPLFIFNFRLDHNGSFATLFTIILIFTHLTFRKSKFLLSPILAGLFGQVHFVIIIASLILNLLNENKKKIFLASVVTIISFMFFGSVYFLYSIYDLKISGLYYPFLLPKVAEGNTFLNFIDGFYYIVEDRAHFLGNIFNVFVKYGIVSTLILFYTFSYIVKKKKIHGDYSLVILSSLVLFAFTSFVYVEEYRYTSPFLVIFYFFFILSLNRSLLNKYIFYILCLLLPFHFLAYKNYFFQDDIAFTYANSKDLCRALKDNGLDNFSTLKKIYVQEMGTEIGIINNDLVSCLKDTVIETNDEQGWFIYIGFINADFSSLKEKFDLDNVSYRELSRSGDYIFYKVNYSITDGKPLNINNIGLPYFEKHDSRSLVINLPSERNAFKRSISLNQCRTMTERNCEIELGLSCTSITDCSLSFIGQPLSQPDMLFNYNNTQLWKGISLNFTCGDNKVSKEIPYLIGGTWERLHDSLVAPVSFKVELGCDFKQVKDVFLLVEEAHVFNGTAHYKYDGVSADYLTNTLSDLIIKNNTISVKSNIKYILE